MKKAWVLFVSAVIFISLNGHAQTNTDNRSLLWRISGKHMSKPSYLFGTIHLICPDDYVWTNKMNECLGNSDELCLEMNIGDPSVMSQTVAAFMDNSGKKLKDYFTPGQYQKIQAYVKDSLGMDIAMFQQMKPVILQMLFVKKGVNCDNPVSYEERLLDIAKKGNKEVAGLEDPKEQIAVLETFPTDSIVKDIIETVKHPASADKQYDEMVMAYKVQDLPALYALMQKAKDKGYDMDPLLDDRNKKWIDRMADKMEQQSVFFAVGAGHLWGQNGVISLLRKAGYMVTPVR